MAKCVQAVFAVVVELSFLLPNMLRPGFCHVGRCCFSFVFHGALRSVSRSARRRRLAVHTGLSSRFRARNATRRMHGSRCARKWSSNIRKPGFRCAGGTQKCNASIATPTWISAMCQKNVRTAMQTCIAGKMERSASCVITRMDGRFRFTISMSIKTAFR